MQQVMRFLGISVVLLVTASSAGFTQKSPFTPSGHEDITVLAAVQAGGTLAEPLSSQLDPKTAACANGCDRYGTKNWRTWSAVMGNRWTDIAGYVVERNRSCFDATAQENDDVQYAHALRRRCDSGGEGLRSTHVGTVATIRDRFMDGVRASSGSMWFNDGGASVSRYKADRPYFFLGMALHTLQDSFSTEHTARSSDWRKLRNYKTYVETRGVVNHVVSLTGAPGDHVRRPSAQAATSPGTMLTPAAQAATDASTDLMKAFEAARNAPTKADMLWGQFETQWLQLDPDPIALKISPSSSICQTLHDGKHIELLRKNCIAEAGGKEPLLSVAYPRFCWPLDKCR